MGPKKIADLSGVSIDPLGYGTLPQVADEIIPGGVHGYGRALGGASSTVKKAAGWWEKRQLAKNAALKLMEPAWYRDKRWQQAKYVSTIDLDISSMRSVSMAGMVAIQRQRNFDRQLALEERALAETMQEKIWEKAFGDDDD